MRRTIASMHVTLDGKTMRSDGRIDWVGQNPDAYDLDAFDGCDACVVGRGMYPEYAQYWRSVAAGAGAQATPEAKRYAEYANSTPHYVLSRTAQEYDWPMAHPVSELLEIAALREQPGGDIYIVGGTTTVAAFINAGLLDELRLTVHPLIIGEGPSLFDTVDTERKYALAEQYPLSDGSLRIAYHHVWSQAETFLQCCVTELLTASSPNEMLTPT